LAIFRKDRRLNLALEGGGAHGAFTWGVLDRLLEDEALEMGWISATSAGAVNAVALAMGLAEGGRAGARAKLRSVWEAVAKAGVPDLLRLYPWLASISRSNTLAQVAQLFSPYDFNPLGFDPLRKLVEAHIDFAALRSSSGPELLIAATDVATGRARLFRRREITVESVLASACLPTLHHAVSIDGRAYWDGGFSANPDLLTLGRESPIGDTLIVKLTALDRDGVPTSAREIAARVNQITFNQPMLRDVEVIDTVRRLHSRWGWRSSPADARLARQRYHLIEAGRFTAALAPESKAKPEIELLNYLHDAGRSETEKWLARNRASIGNSETVDLARHFLSPRSAAGNSPSSGVNSPTEAA
jgi:NTE family protein